MQYFHVFQWDSGNLLLVNGDWPAYDAADALLRWREAYGDNYGKVVILPQPRTSYHLAYNLAATGV